ncbi:uncharacterized protein V6R79_015332 [Siganus canaliculatus]
MASSAAHREAACIFPPRSKRRGAADLQRTQLAQNSSFIPLQWGQIKAFSSADRTLKTTPWMFGEKARHRRC